MSYRHIGKSTATVSRRVRLPVQVCLAALAAGCAFSIGPGANAATPGLADSDGWPGARLGNGKFNHNSFVINSPSLSHDIQHIRNINVGGNTVTPAAICKRHVHHCKIVQRFTVVDP
ncbi:MAG: hypothetical protein JWP48_4517 [Actinoallomurus sp.]|jgi:hypothetical protein|nr:hypothetical protein [Actinoallomurus sp.]